MNSFYKEFGPKQPTQYYGNQSTPQMPFLQNAMNRAQQIMQTIRSPQQFVAQNFGNIPAQIQNDPDQILQYFQQNQSMLNPVQRQVLNMLYRR